MTARFLLGLTLTLTACGGGTGSTGDGGSGGSAAPTIPAPPALPTAEAGNTEVTLNWQRSAGATTYNIYVSGDTGVTPETGGIIDAVFPPYTVRDLSNGSDYFFIITALNNAGESEGSAEVSATPVSDVVLDPPDDLAIEPGDSSLTLTWSAVTGATSYHLYYGATEEVNANDGLQIANVSSPYTHLGLNNGETYYYVITAVGEGTESIGSDPVVSGTPFSLAPEPPVGVAVAAGDTDITLTWDTDEAVSSYTIYWSTTQPVTNVGSNTIENATPPHVFADMPRGVPHYFAITASNEYGEGNLSVQANAQVAPHKISDRGVYAWFAEAGSNFGDLVGNDGDTWLASTDAACASDAGFHHACLNGFLFRAVDVYSVSEDCTTLSAVDSLGAFEWACVEGDGFSTMVTVGFTAAAGLTDIIDFSGPAFLPIRITVDVPGVPIFDEPSVWWDNATLVAATGGTELTTPGKIYVFSSNPDQAITLGTSGTAVVVDPQVTLTGPGGGEGSSLVILDADATWFEGYVDASGYAVGVAAAAAGSVVRRSAIWGIGGGGDTAGVSLSGQRHLVQGVRFRGVGGAGLRVDGERHSIVDSIFAVAGSVTAPAADIGGSNHVLAGLSVHNSPGNGIWSRAEGSVGRDWLVSSGDNGGVILSAAQTLGGVAVITTAGTGIEVAGGADGRLSDVLVANTDEALAFVSSTGWHVHNFVADGSVSADVSIFGETTADMEFHGVARFGANSQAQCDAPATGAGGGPYGLRQGDNGTCELDGGTAILSTTSLASAFVGPYFNPEFAIPIVDPQGAAFDAITGVDAWTFRFHPYMAWGRAATESSGTDPLGVDFAGSCVGPACYLWDWRLFDTATGALELNGPVLGASDSATHRWSANEEQCADLPGAVWSAQDSSCTSTHLDHTRELLMDGIGNDNGLCEAAERCLLVRNAGAYQGGGSLVTGQASVDGGDFAGVTLLTTSYGGEAIPE